VIKNSKQSIQAIDDLENAGFLQSSDLLPMLREMNEHMEFLAKHLQNKRGTNAKTAKDPKQ
tara:strand:+ start:785 stop:967 length:183 start_codon:yes stop_codon:yes gene_type:complete